MRLPERNATAAAAAASAAAINVFCEKAKCSLVNFVIDRRKLAD